MPVGESDKRPQRACYHWAPECLHLRATGSPMISSVTRRSYKSLCLSADRVYTFGRGKSWCDFYFRDRRVSRRHCQVLFDGYEHKVFIIDGTFSSSSDLKTDEVRETLGEGEACASWKGSNRSLNGVYVNCSRLKGRAIFQLSVGDVVSFVCGDSSSSIGFVIDRIVLTDGTVWGNNMDSAYRSADQSCCDLQSVQDQCLLSVYDRLSKLYLSRTPSPGKVISRKTTFTDAELSQDSIDSLCGRLVQISRHLKQPKNSCSRRRKVHYFEVDQRSGYSPLHGESKIGGTGGEASGGFTDTNSLLIVLNTFEKRSLKRSRFCQMDSDRDLILRALLLLKKCKFARKKLNHTVYFNNSFRNSSALVGRKRSNTEPLINCSFPLKANRGIFNHFNRLDALQKGTDCIASDAILSDNGGNNLVADTSSIGIERNDEIVKHTSCCNLSPAKEKLKNGSVCLRELDRCTKVPSVDIELNENYSVGNRKEQIENSCEIPGISALDGSTGKEARVCFIGYSQENSVIHHKMTLRHGIANEGNSVDCTPSVPHMSSVTGLHSNFVDENIEGLKLSKGIHAPESDGKMLFLNRLEFMNIRSTERPASVSLPELLSPVDSLSRIFIATFTSDIWWFLSACKIPNDLPITVACHNADRCWNPAHEQRWSQPYAQYPNLVAVYPPFPDEISITKDKKKRGVACHHPKLFLLLRDESICVVITSANLVPKQWNNVTNTIWWQDFPRRNSPDFSSLFTCSRGEREEISEDSKSDFLAQLAGFVSSLVVDIPNQAYWIKELCNYDFRKASGHLVSSIPGIHESMFPSNLEHVHYLTELQPIHQTATRSLKFVGSVLASLVGLSHRFQAKVDPSGARLKALASVIQKCSENVYGMLEVKLQRNHCIPADSSAVSVVINYPAECLEDGACHEDRLQLGFLPRSVAKWVAPLCDAALFSFSAYVFPRELLAAALSGSNSKVKLVLYVSQGPNFSKISNLIQHAHVVAICYLLVSIQRSHGIWRLHEVQIYWISESK